MGEKAEHFQIPKISGHVDDTNHAFAEAYKTMALPQIIKEAGAALQASGQSSNVLDFGAHAALYGDRSQTTGPQPADAPAASPRPGDAKAVAPARPENQAPAGDHYSKTIHGDGSHQKYEIQQGDNLTSIARRHLGPGASQAEVNQHIQEIAKQNHIADPNKIVAHHHLDLPEHHAHGRTDRTHHDRHLRHDRHHDGPPLHDDSKRHDLPPKHDLPPPSHEAPPPPKDLQAPPGGKLEHTADGGTKITDAKGNASTTWQDGTNKQENTDGSGYIRKPDGQGGYSEHHWGKLPRDNFDVKDVASEHKHTEQLAEKAFKGRPEELKKFKEHMKEFEDRAKKDGLPPEEVAKTYKEIGRLLDAKGETPLKSDERSAIAGQVMKQAAEPTTVDQGNHNTCNVASVESRMYTKMPSEAARLVTDVATTGHFTAYDGTTVNINPQAHGSSKDRVCNDGDRSHASEIFQVTAVNMHYAHENAKTDPPGQVRYEQEKNPHGSKDSGEHLRDYSTHPPTELGQSPDLPDKSLTEVCNTISGKSEKDIVLVDPKNSYKSPDGVKAINSEEELNKTLADAKKEGKLPLIVRVNTEAEPFYRDSGAGAAGGSGGAHVVNITDYEPGPPARVKIDNQWGTAADHNGDDSKVSVHDLYNSMRNSKDCIEDLKKDVAWDRAHNTVDTQKEFELLRLEKSDGQITEQQYTDQLTKLVKDTKERWDKQQKDGTLNPSDVANGKAEMQAAVANLDPADRFKVMAVENKIGLMTDQDFNHELALSSWRATHDRDQLAANGELKDEDTKKYNEFMKAFNEALDGLPKDRQMVVLTELKGYWTYAQEQEHKKH